MRLATGQFIIISFKVSEYTLCSLNIIYIPKNVYAAIKE